jgi:hypothetical protein
MAEELNTQEQKTQDYTDVTTLNNKGDGDRKWYQIAEVRMVMYVVPVAILFLILAYVLSNVTK